MALATTIAALCGGQSPARVVRVTAENDYFLFSQPPNQRPDEDYTHGTRISWDIAATPPTARRLFCVRRAACSSNLEVGQAMYTPIKESIDPIPGQRPYAGWLYVRGVVSATTASGRRSLFGVVGVTGRASLAQQTQDAFHHLVGFRTPLGWNHQLPTEPDFAVGASIERYLSAPASLPRMADLVPEGRVTLGTLRTAIGAGGRLRLGFGLTHPWLADPESRRFEAYAFAGAHAEVVLRDLFLDGSTFHPSPSVKREPLVADREWGIAARVLKLSLEYRLVTRGREYRSQPSAHPFGGITLSWWIVR